MDNIVKLVIEDDNTQRRIIVAICQKSISAQDRFSNDLANELLKFLLKNAGKPMGEQRSSEKTTSQKDVNYFSEPQNKKPYEEKVQKVYIE